MKKSCKLESCKSGFNSDIGFEVLEERMLLSVTVPTFGTALPSAVWVPATGGGRTLGIDGVDKAGESLTITATSDNPLLTVTVPTGEQYAKMHFVDANNKVIGDILVQLFNDRSSTAVSRFVTLATEHVNDDNTLSTTGAPFYTNVLVHRVIPGFMIQTGDAKNGNGTGGSGLGTFADSFDPSLAFEGPGVLAMANSGANTNDSQFFITDAPTEWLNGSYFIFGQVISGMSVLEKIINVPRDSNDKPDSNITMQSVQILNSSPQDGTVTMVAQAGLTGEAHVTIKMDDGHGGVTTKVITVRSMGDLGDRPTIASQADKTMTAGTTMTFNVTVTDDHSLPFTVTGQTDNSLAHVVVSQIDATTEQVTFTAPANFTGLAKIFLSAVESGGWDSLSPNTQIFNVQVTCADDMNIQNHIAVPVTNSLAGGTDLAGHYLYVAQGDVTKPSSGPSTGAVYIYDVSNPSSPTLVGQYATTNSARQVEVVGNTAVVDTEGGLVTLDVTDPTKPTLLGTASANYFGVSMVVDSNTVWLADYAAGVTVYDITDPSNITQTTTITTVGPVQFNSKDNSGNPTNPVTGLAKKGNFLFISGAGGVVAVANVSVPTTPVFVTYFGVGYSPWDMQIQGNTLYMADPKALLAWDITTPATPKLLGKLAMTDGWMVTLAGNVAVVARSRGYSFVDISNPKKMVVKQVLDDPAVYEGHMNWTGTSAVNAAEIALPMGGDGVVLLDGTLGVTNGSVSFLDGSGATVTVSVSKGTVKVDTANTWGGAINDVKVIGTPATSVTITSSAVTSLGAVDVVGSVKSFVAKTADLAGTFTVDGSIESLVLHNIGSNLIDINGAAAGMKVGAATAISLTGANGGTIDTELPIKSLAVGDVTNLHADSIGALSKLTAIRWTGGSITADTIGAIAVNGATGIPADMTATIDTKSIKSMAVKGNLVNSVLTLTQPVNPLAPKVVALGSLAVSGRLDSTQIRSAGNVGNVKAGVIRDSLIFAGVKDTVTQLPSGSGDFVAADPLQRPVIGSVQAVGMPRGLPVEVAFDNSVVSAWTISKTSLKTVQFDNSSNADRIFGLAGHTIGGYPTPVITDDFQVDLLS